VQAGADGRVKNASALSRVKCDAPKRACDPLGVSPSAANRFISSVHAHSNEAHLCALNWHILVGPANAFTFICRTKLSSLDVLACNLCNCCSASVFAEGKLIEVCEFNAGEHLARPTKILDGCRATKAK
jgi:hypothetical protein